jgi:hypothetical protein
VSRLSNSFERGVDSLYATYRSTKTDDSDNGLDQQSVRHQLQVMVSCHTIAVSICAAGSAGGSRRC